MTAGELLVIVGMALAVYLPKAVPLIAVSEALTTRLGPWLRYVAPAVLGALIAPAIVAPAGHVAAPGWELAPYLMALVAALLTRRMVPSLGIGLVVLVLIAALTPA
jgi:branched-subunit amino acid transport protein